MKNAEILISNVGERVLKELMQVLIENEAENKASIIFTPGEKVDIDLVEATIYKAYGETLMFIGEKIGMFYFEDIEGTPYAFETHKLPDTMTRATQAEAEMFYRYWPPYDTRTDNSWEMGGDY